MSRWLYIQIVFSLTILLCDRAASLHAQPPIGNFKAHEVNPVEEAYIFTPPGFDKPGKLAVAEGDNVGTLKLSIRDKATGEPTRCRVNVVGPDGHFYQPESDLKLYGFTDNWPANGSRGNRIAKGPFRYLGCFFYTRGEDTIKVPAGKVRIEVWKGFEYRPVSETTKVEAGGTRSVDVALEQTLPMRELGYYSGDPHIHVPRMSKEEDSLALDLMEAEGIYYGSILCYNEPPGPYSGIMSTQDMPQRSMGVHSLRARGDFEIVSGQEYRSGLYGHLNLHMRDELVLQDQSVDADDGPVYGELAQQVRNEGGIAVYAHGGYALEVYADAVQENIDAIEMLQFSKYRGIGLEHWYHLLNAGFQIPMTGASDYPACRFLGDCKTYVHHAELPGFGAWYRGMADGQSFVTSGPMLLLEVDGQRPGATIERTKPGARHVTIRVNSEVAPVTNLQVIVNGQVVKEVVLDPDDAWGKWYELQHTINLKESFWIAARAFSFAPTGSADAESHTNPVYVIHTGKAPYKQESVDVLLKELDRQIAHHQAREFEQKAKTLAYFLRSKDILQEIISAGGRTLGDKDHQAATGNVDMNAKAVAGDEEALKRVLRSIPAKSPEEALATFTAVEPFHMELVASEPLLNDPICAAIDENGLLYVGEMTDYPYFPAEGKKPIGSVSVLEDTDDDGRYDKSTRFAEELLWVGGIAPWQGGVYVAAPPDIWYLKDTDGDCRADFRRKVFTGFGTQNQQGMLNNLKWGPDQKIYGSSSVNGGKVRRADNPDAKPVALDGHDFRFDPRTEVLEPISGVKQFGNTFDDWGNRFVCSQGQPLLQVVLPQRYLARNPYLPTASALHSLAPSPTPVFRTSPVEMWREIRSRRRILANRSPATGTGVSHHVIDAGAGVTVYRGGAYPKEFYGNIFVGGAQNNLVHRRVLESDGVTFSSKRGNDNAEFVQSTDNWFRPVNLVNAPDGTLYVLDMCREILEAIHIPLDVVKHLDLKNGRDRGRIYRIAPQGFQSPPQPRLGEASTAELVSALESPHGWYRDTASRLLFERQDESAVEPLQKLVAQSDSTITRFAALWALDGLDALEEKDLLRALSDESAEIRKAALRLSESRLAEPAQLRDRVFALADDKSPIVRFQLAFTLGETDDPRATEILADYAKLYAGDQWMRTAILSSSSASTDRLLIKLLEDKEITANGQGLAMLLQMGRVVGAKNLVAETTSVLHALEGTEDRKFQRLTVQAIGEGLKLSGKRFEVETTITPNVWEKLLKPLIAEAVLLAEDGEANLEKRKQAINLLGCMPLETSETILAGLLAAEHPPTLQLVALEALEDYSDTTVAELVIAQWSTYTPEILDRAIRTLLGREAWTLALLSAAEKKEVSLSQFDSAQRSQLLDHTSNAVARLAKRLLGDEAPAPRNEIVQRYQPCLKLTGNALDGEQVFSKTCAVCHSIAGKGYAVGPDLTSIGSLDPEAMLVHILDPNRYVLPRYVQYVVRDVSGRIHTGLVSSQTAASVTLVREQHESDTILRDNIEEMIATNKSLMPEGLEEKISEQDMADLIAYITAAGKKRGVRPETDTKAERDFGTLPRLIEPEQN